MADKNEFSESFKSSLFTVYVGAERTAYHLHKDLLSRKCPYFKMLLSFPGVESSTQTVHLDSEADTVQAFDMFVEYLYHDTYMPQPSLPEAWKTQTHAEVYVLAERLLMPALKRLALDSMARVLSRMYGTKNIERFDPESQQWAAKTTSVVDLAAIAELVGTVYSNIASSYSLPTSTQPQEKKEKEPAAEEESTKVEGAEVQPTKPTKPTKPNDSRTTPINPKDPMQRLVARYCASVIDDIRGSRPEMVMELSHAYPEFAANLIMELGQRAENVNSTEIEDILREG